MNIFYKGAQGRAPDPFWDPLKFIITEARARGLEVHAWLNPYRARNKGDNTPFHPSHMAVKYPSVAYNYDGYVWMDPGSNTG